jgi:hypothetical protein
MSTVLIAAPLRLEALLIESGAPGVRVFRTGMGPRRARAAASRLLREPGDTSSSWRAAPGPAAPGPAAPGRVAPGRAALLLVMGFCGGLEQDAEPGEVVVAEEVRGPHGAVVCPEAEALADTLRRHGLWVRQGPLASVARPVRGAKHKARLRADGAIAVDMESAWLAAAVGAATGSAAGGAMGSAARAVTGSAAGAATGSAMGGAMGSAARAVTGSAAGAATGSAMGVATGSAAAAGMGSATEGATEPGASGRSFAVVRVVVDTPTREWTRPLLTFTGGVRAAVCLRAAASALHERALS